eukprot:TRINITY_DN99651_c0_g1_i1.p1 TRINITY_DN99651_c0_g1~~TRINITY_DN99651_c0_g1_i1.p1  ORF type:complete len:395 (-),score=70.64 TRINITY_DN99651_c0_g1_i1:154-1305(-)
MASSLSGVSIFAAKGPTILHLGRGRYSAKTSRYAAANWEPLSTDVVRMQHGAMTATLAIAAAALAAILQRLRLRRRERRYRSTPFDGLSGFLSMKLREMKSQESDSALQINSLSNATLGAEISGLDISVELSEKRKSELRSALWKHGLLLFRDQDLLEEDVIQFSRIFAQPVAARSQPKELAIYNVSDRSGVQRGQDFWHSDNSYAKEPGGPTLLYALKIPVGSDGKSFGDTLFLDAASACEKLPLKLRSKVVNRTASHNIAHNNGEPLPEFESEEPDDVNHPILRPHPKTGQETLFVSQSYVRKVNGVSKDESTSLLQELFQHLYQDSVGGYRHIWRPDDLLIWDNDKLQHKATTLEMPRGLDRIMWRVQTVPYIDENVTNS